MSKKYGSLDSECECAYHTLTMKKNHFFAIGFVLFTISSGFSQTNTININDSLLRLQTESDQVVEGTLIKISDELLDELYYNWMEIVYILPESSPSEALDFLLPPYQALNSALQVEVQNEGGGISLRIAKLTSIIANLFPTVLQNSKDYIQTLDTESYTYATRISGYKQAQVGGANMVLGTMITLFTEELHDDIANVLKNELWSFGPSIIRGIDDIYKRQLLDFAGKNITPNVIPEMEVSYAEFSQLIK